MGNATKVRRNLQNIFVKRKMQVLADFFALRAQSEQ